MRDLILCAGDPSLDVPIEEIYAHPPIGWDRHPGVDDERFGETVDAIDLGGGIVIEELDRDTAERLYEGRSDWVHGSHVQLFTGESAGADTSPEEEPERPPSSDERSVLAEVTVLQDVLRGAVRRAIEDGEFRQIFVADETIAARWRI